MLSEAEACGGDVGTMSQACMILSDGLVPRLCLALRVGLENQHANPGVALAGPEAAVAVLAAGYAEVEEMRDKLAALGLQRCTEDAAAGYGEGQHLGAGASQARQADAGAGAGLGTVLTANSATQATQQLQRGQYELQQQQHGAAGTQGMQLLCGPGGVEDALALLHLSLSLLSHSDTVGPPAHLALARYLMAPCMCFIASELYPQVRGREGWGDGLGCGGLQQQQGRVGGRSCRVG